MAQTPLESQRDNKGHMGPLGVPRRHLEQELRVHVKVAFNECLVSMAGGKKYRKHRSASSTGRPTSPYSTDSNFSAVVHKPYPKSERKKQLQEQGVC